MWQMERLLLFQQKIQKSPALQVSESVFMWEGLIYYAPQIPDEHIVAALSVLSVGHPADFNSMKCYWKLH